MRALKHLQADMFKTTFTRKVNSKTTLSQAGVWPHLTLIFEHQSFRQGLPLTKF